MKTTKKLASLFLALLMALSCMAMPAMAAGDEHHDHECAVCSEGTIMPRKPAFRCYACDQEMTEIARGTDINGNGYITFACQNPQCTRPSIISVPWN